MRSWVKELKKEIKKDVYEKRPTSPIDHCVFEEDSQKPLQSFIEIANEHKDKKTLKQQREEIFLEIVIKEKELLEKYTDIKIKYYDWKTGQHVNPNSIILFTSIIKERIRELDRVILEGMTTKDFKHLYGGIDSTGILSISPNLVSSTFAQDLVTKGVEATTHQFGSEFPGSYVNSIGDFSPQSYSKVDAQAHITTPHGVTANQGEMAHPENHVFTYQSFQPEGSELNWPTEYTLPTSFIDDLMYFDAEGNPQEWINYIWPTHGHPGTYTPLDSDDDDTPFWHDAHPHTEPGSAWGYNEVTVPDDDGTAKFSKNELRMMYNRGRIDRRSITESSFDVTYGAARSIDSTSFDLIGQPDEPSFSNDPITNNARLQWGKSITTTGVEDWQYIKGATQTDYIDQIYGFNFPFTEHDYDPEGGYDDDGWQRIHPNVNTTASFTKKIMRNVNVGDKISFSYTWYSDTWQYEVDLLDSPDFGDVDTRSSHFRAIIGADNRVVSIKDQWQRQGADPSRTLTDGTYTIPSINQEAYENDNIVRSSNGFSYPYSGTYEYTVQQGDIDAAGLFQFSTALLNESTNLEYVQVTNFAHTIGDQSRTAAGQLGQTTDAYDLGYSVKELKKMMRENRLNMKMRNEIRRIEKDLVKKYGRKMRRIIDNLGYRFSMELAKISQNFSTLKNAGDAFANFLLQQQGLKNYTKENPYNVKMSAQDRQAVADTINSLLETQIPKERWNNLNQRDLDLLNNALNPKEGKTPTNKYRTGNEPSFDEYHTIFNNLGEKDGLKVKIGKDGKPYVTEINDNYVFENDADASMKGAPELINIFTKAFDAQGRMGDTPYQYQIGDPSDAKSVDAIAPPKKVNVKNMNIRMKLPTPVNEELYPGQPSPNGFPVNLPPKLAPNGYHPDFGKRSDRYRRLDPVSAVVMNKVKTDDPETNKQVAAAAKKSKLKSVKEFKKGLDGFGNP